MKYQKMCRMSCLFTLLTLLICLLSMSAFAGSNAEWGYQQLDENQKGAYREIEAVIAARGSEVDIYKYSFDVADRDELTKVIQFLVADHPEYYWFLGDYGGTAMGGKFKTFQPIYDTTYKVLCGPSCQIYDGAKTCSLPGCLYGKENPDKTDLAQTAFTNAVNDILAGCPKSGSDYKKAQYLHDELVNRITYSYDYQLEQSAYSALVNGKAVCAGYARAYQYLLNQVGIDAWTVKGFGWNSQKGSLEKHAWNLVWIDGKCVYTDVTWDDQGDPIYAYFNRSFDVISRDHMTDSDTDPLWVDYFGDDLPKSCDHDDETYFVMNGINKIPEVSIETLATNVKGEDGTYVIHVLLNESFDFDEFSAWFDNDRRNNLIDAIGVYRYGSFSIGYSYMGDELRIVIEPSTYSTPSPDLIGYICEITAKGKLTAYTNYAGTDLTANKTYDAVMVAYYSDEGELQEVSFTEMRLDKHGRGKIEADCPDDFDYCRIFVVDSDANPAPLCDFLELEWAN